MIKSGQVLESTESVSETFIIDAKSIVILEGTLSGSWHVQAARRGVASPVWTNVRHTGYNQNEKYVVVEGTPDLDYRINIGSDTNVLGFVYKQRTQTLR